MLDKNNNMPQKNTSEGFTYYIQVSDEKMSYRVVFFGDTIYLPFVITLQLQFVEQGDDDSKLNVQFLLIYRCLTDPLFDFLKEYINPWILKNHPDI